MDQDLRKKLAGKIDEGEFGVGDIESYLTLFAAVGNENDDVKDEVEDWDRLVVLQLAEGDAYWLKIEGGAFESGKGAPEGATLVLKAKGATIAAILCGEKDATMAYTTGALKIDGKLPDAVKMRSLIGLVREEIEG
jgi:putative sterol carrier protein